MNKYDYIFFTGIALWFAETWYFGFNATAVNGIEATLDFATLCIAGVGGLGSCLNAFAPKINIYNTNVDRQYVESLRTALDELSEEKGAN